MSLLSELKRRNVVRVALACLAAAWLLLEVASAVLPSFLARRDRDQANEWMRRTIEKIGAQQPDPGGGYVIWLSANVMRDPVLDEPEFVALPEQLRGR